MPSGFGVAPDREVREHEVDGVGLELSEELAQGTRPHHHLDIRPHEKRTKELELEVPRQGRHRADAQDAAAGRGPVLQGVDHLLAGSEDRLRVVERDASGLGEAEPLVAPLEQFLAQAFLELPELDAERRRREPQQFGRMGEVASVAMARK